MDYSFVCDFCAKPFGRKSHLIRHINDIHTKINKLWCPELGCARFSTQKQNLYAHMRTHQRRSQRKLRTVAAGGPSLVPEVNLLVDAMQLPQPTPSLPNYTAVHSRLKPSTSRRALSPPDSSLAGSRDGAIAYYSNCEVSPTYNIHPTPTPSTAAAPGRAPFSYSQPTTKSEAPATPSFPPPSLPEDCQGIPAAHPPTPPLEKMRVRPPWYPPSYPPPLFHHSYPVTKFVRPSDTLLRAGEAQGSRGSCYDRILSHDISIPFRHPSDDVYGAHIDPSLNNTISFTSNVNQPHVATLRFERDSDSA